LRRSTGWDTSDLLTGYMSKSKHHYVPRFYLKSFASEPRRIHIFNMDKGLAVQSGSLRDQCYRNKFYGKTDELEDSLAGMEGKIAPVITSILNTSRSFRLNSEEHKWLLIFLGLQITRTAAAARGVDESTDKIFKTMFSRDARVEGMDLSLVKVGFKNPVLHSMVAFVEVAAHLADLIPHLVINELASPFITSDNPVVLYNQYCEGVKGVGTTGATSRGLQVFVPLSPTSLLLLYDQAIYKVSDRDAHITVLSKADDVGILNLLNAANAEQILLFSKWENENAVRRLAQKSKKYRRAERATVEEFLADDDPEHSSLVHLFQQPLDIGLNLSFMKLRRHAQRIPLAVRIQEHRDLPHPIASGQPGRFFRRSEPRN
jgi:hypothetical protein